MARIAGVNIPNHKHAEIALTAVYGFGVVGRPLHTHFRLGPDSILALALFGLGIAGLFVVPS